jgi:hypothetical protein
VVKIPPPLPPLAPVKFLPPLSRPHLAKRASLGGHQNRGGLGKSIWRVSRFIRLPLFVAFVSFCKIRVPAPPARSPETQTANPGGVQAGSPGLERRVPGCAPTRGYGPPYYFSLSPRGTSGERDQGRGVPSVPQPSTPAPSTILKSLAHAIPIRFNPTMRTGTLTNAPRARRPTAQKPCFDAFCLRAPSMNMLGQTNHRENPHLSRKMTIPPTPIFVFATSTNRMNLSHLYC